MRNDIVGETVCVKRDGGKGWRNIAKANYDPAKHELYSAVPPVSNLPPPPMTVAKTPAEVLASVDVVHWKTFEAEARKVLGVDMPRTKDEIIQALRAMTE